MFGLFPPMQPGRRVLVNPFYVEGLAEGLRIETSPAKVLKNLHAVTAVLAEPQTGGDAARMFAQAGGLPPLIRHLAGTATSPATSSATSSPNSDAEITPFTISEAAREALEAIHLHPVAKTPGFISAVGDFTPLLDALRDAPSVHARSTAAAVLFHLARTQPMRGKAMADAGVLRLALAAYVEFCRGSLGAEKPAAPVNLARLLVWGESVAARELAGLIRAPQAEQAFHALVFFDVRRVPALTRLRTLNMWTNHDAPLA
jgi:hypothetical protein